MKSTLATFIFNRCASTVNNEMIPFKSSWIALVRFCSGETKITGSVISYTLINMLPGANSYLT